jgi:predicted O-methyltransferase YrrM
MTGRQIRPRDALKVLKQYLGAIIGPMHLGMIDYFRFPKRRNPWGGPFNGQKRRQDLFVSVVLTCQPAAIIETGTHAGASTEFMAEVFKLPVYSVEIDARNLGFAKMRLRKHRNVKLSLGDSREFLTKFITVDALRYMGRPLLFYLDAHWGKDLPLSNELSSIFSSFSQAIVMIDDFQVPGDAGYGYDDYGFGKALNREYIGPQVKQFQLAEFYPSAPSAAETSIRRGCIVLAHDPRVIGALSSISLLRRMSD